MKDNSPGRIARSSPGSKRSYNSTGRIRSWVNPTQGQPPSPLPPNGGQQRTRVCRSWELSCCCGSCEATKKKKKKKNTSPLIISHFPPQSQVFLIKKIKNFLSSIWRTFVRFTVNKKRGLFALYISCYFISSYFYWFIFS